MAVRRLVAESSRSRRGRASDPELKTGVGILEGLFESDAGAEAVGLCCTGDSSGSWSTALGEDCTSPSIDIDTVFRSKRSLTAAGRLSVGGTALSDASLSSPGSKENLRPPVDVVSTFS